MRKITLVGANGHMVVNAGDKISKETKDKMTGGGDMHVIEGDVGALLNLRPQDIHISIPQQHKEAIAHIEAAKSSICAARGSVLTGWKNP